MIHFLSTLRVGGFCLQFSFGSFAFIFVVYFLSFFIKGLAGFGDPLISSPLLALRYTNQLISPANLLISTPVNAILAWRNRAALQWRQVLPMAASMLLGVIPGTLLLKAASSWVLKAILGVVVFAIGAEMFLRSRTAPATKKPNPLIMGLVCFCSGLTSGLYGINMFFVAYAQRHAQHRSGFRASIGFIFLLENLFRILMYAITGVFTANAFRLTLAALPGVAAGFAAGLLVDKYLSEKTVRAIVIVVVMLGGLSVLLKALITHT